jgi:hypothetical protein
MGVARGCRAGRGETVGRAHGFLHSFTARKGPREEYIETYSSDARRDHSRDTSFTSQANARSPCQDVPFLAQ